VTEEDHTIWLSHRLLLEERRFPLGYADTLFPTAAWEEYKGVLARAISDERLWEALAALYSCAPHASAVVADQDAGSPLDDQMHDAIRKGEELARFVYEKLTAESRH
jgi:hypothetical protein